MTDNDQSESKPQRVWTEAGLNVWTPARLDEKRYHELVGMLPVLESVRESVPQVQWLASMVSNVVRGLKPDAFVAMDIEDRLPHVEAAVVFYCGKLPKVVAEDPLPFVEIPLQQPHPQAKEVLIGWPEIMEEIKRLDENWRMVYRLNKATKGPIKTKRGSPPRVDRFELIAWWNKQNDRHDKKQEQDELDEFTLGSLEQVNYGKTGLSVPEIGGGVKKRRK